MAATVYSLFSGTDMPPGATWSFGWNNIPDGLNRRFAVDATPFYPGSYQEGYNSTTELEITRFWRKTRSIEKPGSIGVTVEIRSDIKGQIKNVGGHKLNFHMYLIVFT